MNNIPSNSQKRICDKCGMHTYTNEQYCVAAPFGIICGGNLSLIDPIHDYILKASPEDVHDMMVEAGLDPSQEADKVKQIIEKRLSEYSTNEIKSIRLNQSELNALLEYSTSVPTGTTIGKRWKRKTDSGWLIGEYIPDQDPKRVGIKWYKVEIIDAPIEVKDKEPVQDPLKNALHHFLSFGRPREGSDRYHKAWDKLKESFEGMK